MSITINLTQNEFNILINNIVAYICDFYGECTTCPLDLKEKNETCILIKLEKEMTAPEVTHEIKKENET